MNAISAFNEMSRSRWARPVGRSLIVAVLAVTVMLSVGFGGSYTDCKTQYIKRCSIDIAGCLACASQVYYDCVNACQQGYETKVSQLNTELQACRATWESGIGSEWRACYFDDYKENGQTCEQIQDPTQRQACYGRAQSFCDAKANTMKWNPNEFGTCPETYNARVEAAQYTRQGCENVCLNNYDSDSGYQLCYQAP